MYTIRLAQVRTFGGNPRGSADTLPAALECAAALREYHEAPVVVLDDDGKIVAELK